MRKRHLLLSTCIVMFAVIGTNAQSKRDFLNMERDQTVVVNPGVEMGGNPCLTWVDPSPTTGYTDFNTNFGGAPCNSGAGCPVNLISDFEVWKGEAYAMAGITAGSSYTFSHCTGPGAGSWVPEYTIIAPGGAVDAFGPGDGDGCSITWTASASGSYLIVINEAGNCGTAASVDNGFPSITCSGTVPCPAACEAGTLNVPTAQCVEFGEATAQFGVIASGVQIPEGGAYAIAFQPVTGQGTGATAPNGFIVTLQGTPTFPITFDSDFGGLLSANSLTPLAGQWMVAGVVLTDAADQNSGCSTTSGTITVNFVAANASCELSAGILDPSAFSVYPNPNNGQFTVSVDGIQGTTLVEVMDLTGKVLHVGQMIMGSSSRMDIDLGARAAGLYLVRFTVNGASHVSKVSVN